MELRRKRVKKIMQVHKLPAVVSAISSLEPLPSEPNEDLIWWVSSSSKPTPGGSNEEELAPNWLRDRLSEFAESETEKNKMETAVKSLLQSKQSDESICNALLEVLGYSDSAMCLVPELISRRVALNRQAAQAAKRAKASSTSFIPGATLGGGGARDRAALPSGTTREWCDFKISATSSAPPIVGRMEVVNVPAAIPAPMGSHEVLVPTSRFGALARRAFDGVDTLNRLQSRLFHSAYETNENLLVVAPTGAGKTNVAMTCIAREIETKSPRGVKCVYIAPMKALAQEVVQKFGERLSALGMTVRELTGDTQLTRAEMDHTQIIVSTPEKWDVISRKGGDMVEMVHLLIIDEVHLVGDERGPVVEALVARTIRQVERKQQMVRIVGLSATLPNYADLALFLRVNPERGLFYFDASFRPVPLDQRFIGVSLPSSSSNALETTGEDTKQQQQQQQRVKPSAAKQQRQLEAVYNDIAFDHALDCVQRGHQVLVFVHTRKDTSRTARALLEICAAKRESAQSFAKQDSAHYQAFARRVSLSKNQDVQYLFPRGFGIHHAGMAREDRSLTEEMFTKGVISVLCCTSTLAWGVNLPSHLVIVKGTQIYAPDRGGICELNSADVFQCFGRAGRPQFDTRGEAVLITEHAQLARYLAMLTHSLPLESKLVQGLPDALNAEIVGGSVATVEEASAWLSYTFLYVRMLKSPTQYGVAFDERKTDPALELARGKLVSQTVRLLAEARMVRIGQVPAQAQVRMLLPSNTPLGVTDLGRVASHYYISYKTVETLFNQRLQRDMSVSELMGAICTSQEFEQLKVREEEMQEIRRLSSQACPFAWEAGVEDTRNPFDTPQAKAFILLQTYISRAPVDAFTLFSDMNYIAQNAARITRALFEVAQSKGWLQICLQTLQLSAAIERQAWWHPMQHPLRQVAPVHVKLETVSVLENAEEDWPLARLLPAAGETEASLTSRFALLNQHQASRLLAAARLLPQCQITILQRQPITTALLRISLRITPAFVWREGLHGTRQSYQLFVDDGEWIFHSERITLQRDEGSVERSIVVPLFQQHGADEYFVRLENDSGWLDVGASARVNLMDLFAMEHATTTTRYTELLPLDPLPITALRNVALQMALAREGLTHFNPVQTQCFHALYHGQDSLIISAPTGAGKTLLAELAMWQVLFGQTTQSLCVVYIAPMKALVSERLADWRDKFRDSGKRIVELTGDSSASQAELRGADLIVATPEKFEVSTRFFREGGGEHFFSRVALIVFDEIHLLGEERGAALEAIVSRVKQRQEHERPIRMIGLSATLANPDDVAQWFSTKAAATVYNFRPAVRTVPLEVHISGFPGAHYCPRMASMNKPVFHAILQHAKDKPVLVFVASRRQTRLTAIDLISLCAASDNPRRFLRGGEDLDTKAVEDEALAHCAQFGIALHHAGLSKADRERAEFLFSSGACQVLVATATLAWGVNLPSYLVIIKGTEYFDAKTRAYSPFPVSDVLQMMGRAGRVQYGEDKGVAVLLVHDQLKPFYKRFLYEPFPLESSLAPRFAVLLNVEICTRRVQSKSDALTYLASTFLAQRLRRNPLYYYGGDARRNGSGGDYFAQLIDASLQQLVRAECCTAELAPLALGEIAARFDLAPESVKFFADKIRQSRRATSTMGWVLETVTRCKDFDELVVRANEEELNRVLAGALEYGAGTYTNLALPNCKAFLLLQAKAQHRLAALPIHDYITDSRQVEDIANRALPAFVAVACALACAPLQFCLDAIRLIFALQTSGSSNAKTLVKIQNVSRVGNLVKCTATGGARAREELWWCLIRTAAGEDGDVVLATSRNGELQIPSQFSDALSLQVVLLSAASSSPGSGIADRKQVPES